MKALQSFPELIYVDSSLRVDLLPSIRPVDFAVKFTQDVTACKEADLYSRFPQVSLKLLEIKETVIASLPTAYGRPTDSLHTEK